MMKIREVGRAAAAVGGAAFLVLWCPTAARAQAPAVQRGAQSFGPVTPTVSKAVRDLPTAPGWQPGDPIIDIPRRGTRRPGDAPNGPTVDPLVAAQGGAKAPSALGPPLFNFDGSPFTGAQPPDTVGDVGANHYIQMVNGSGGGAFRIYDKHTGVLLAGPTLLETLATTAPCNSGFGDPIVLYDQFADRWLMSEFSFSGSNLCVYVSQTPDPGGPYFAYRFQTPFFPDYPKYGVWPDAYYVGTNESSPGPAAYALQRSAMLAGAPAAFQRFNVLPPLAGFGFESIQPADADGALPPPAGAPGQFWRHNDSEAHGTAGAPDMVQYFEFHVDFVTPANSTFTGPININVAEFDSNTCGLTAFNCVPQPGTTTTLDPLREPVMHRAQYRNRGTHEVVVGSFMTDVGTNLHGVRWYEVRRSGVGAFALFQEGTLGGAPDTTHRWMSSIAMDGFGNIALAYNVSSSTVFPGLRYTGRVATDPPGLMAAEQTIIAGTTSVPAGIGRYGDYASMNVDPANECTFWFTGEYNASAAWTTRITTFTFPVPECIPVPVSLKGFTVE